MDMSKDYETDQDRNSGTPRVGPATQNAVSINTIPGAREDGRYFLNSPSDFAGMNSKGLKGLGGLTDDKASRKKNLAPLPDDFLNENIADIDINIKQVRPQKSPHHNKSKSE